MALKSKVYAASCHGFQTSQSVVRKVVTTAHSVFMTEGIDLGLHRNRFNADQGKRIEFREHGADHQERALPR